MNNREQQHHNTMKIIVWLWIGVFTGLGIYFIIDFIKSLL